MEKYLDPKNDLVFKKIFGEHPDLLISFLNAVLELPSPITSTEYLPAELVPQIPVAKNSIVDVRCIDQNKRQFIVEMQMLWVDDFKERILFNASKAYVKQLNKGEKYEFLEPVYAISLVNQNYNKSERYYHQYKILNVEGTGEQIEGLEFLFVELKKLRQQKPKDKSLQTIWLRFLAEIDEYIEQIPQEFKDNPAINQALEITKESAFSLEELAAYERYWDSIQTQATLVACSRRQALEEGLEKGLAKGEVIGLKKGEEIGLEKGQYLERYQTIKKLEAKGKSLEETSDLLDLSIEEIIAIKKMFEDL
jgi:predicted transposase/invertase (TIGR01784 family)